MRILGLFHAKKIQPSGLFFLNHWHLLPKPLKTCKARLGQLPPIAQNPSILLINPFFWNYPSANVLLQSPVPTNSSITFLWFGTVGSQTNQGFWDWHPNCTHLPIRTMTVRHESHDKPRIKSSLRACIFLKSWLRLIKATTPNRYMASRWSLGV